CNLQLTLFSEDLRSHIRMIRSVPDGRCLGQVDPRQDGLESQMIRYDLINDSFEPAGACSVYMVLERHVSPPWFGKYAEYPPVLDSEDLAELRTFVPPAIKLVRDISWPRATIVKIQHHTVCLPSAHLLVVDATNNAPRRSIPFR